MNHQRHRGSNYKQQLNAVYINKIAFCLKIGQPQHLSERTRSIADDSDEKNNEWHQRFGGIGPR